VSFLLHTTPSSPRRALGQQGVRVREAIAEAQQIGLGARQQCLQSRAPLREGLIAKIAALQLHEIEAVDAHGDMAAVQQRKEIGLAVGASGDLPSMMQDFTGSPRTAAVIPGNPRLSSPPFLP
jgi:hypothetical protein